MMILWTQNGTDFLTLEQTLDAVLRLGAAALLGGLLGYQRSCAQQAAGLRTHILAAIGSCLFVMAPIHVGMSVADLSRIIQGLATGIGFLGTGAILKLEKEQSVSGLTTAAGLWLTGAVGMAVGIGSLEAAIFGISKCNRCWFCGGSLTMH